MLSISDLLSFSISVVLTALYYCAVPLILARTAKISVKTYKRICIAYIAVVWFVMQFIYIYLGESAGSIYPAVIWGAIAYKIGAKTVEKRAKEKKKQQSIETWYTCPDCGSLVRTGAACDCGFKYRGEISEAKEVVETYVQPIYKSYDEQKAEKRRKKILMTLVLAVLFASSAAGWITAYSYSKKLDQKNEQYIFSEERAKNLEKQIDTLIKQRSKLQSQLYEANSSKSEGILKKYGVSKSKNDIVKSGSKKTFNIIEKPNVLD